MSWIRFIFHTLRNIIPDRIGVVVARYHTWMPFSPCHIILHPSFFCNYKCPYCSNQFYESRYPKSIELDYGEWLELLGKMPGSLITISGGEPLLYGNLDKLLLGLSKKHVISKIMTNISSDVAPLVRTRKIGYRVVASFHPDMTGHKDFGKKLALLKECGFRIIVNYAATVANMERYDYYKDYFEKKLKIRFRAWAFEDLKNEPEINSTRKIYGINYGMRKNVFNNHKLKNCLAGNKYFIILPNADVFRCITGYMYTTIPGCQDIACLQDLGRFSLGNLKSATLRIHNNRFVCRSPCKTVCDIELAKVTMEQKTL